VLGAEHLLADGQQRRVLVAGLGRVPRLPGEVGEAGPDGQGFRVLGAGHLLADGQQGGVLVAGGGRVPRLCFTDGAGVTGGTGGDGEDGYGDGANSKRSRDVVGTATVELYQRIEGTEGL
jgi:hypothetical protein